MVPKWLQSPGLVCIVTIVGGGREFGALRCQILYEGLFRHSSCVLKYVRGVPEQLVAKSW